MWIIDYCMQCGKPITHGPTGREYVLCSACELGFYHDDTIPLAIEPSKEPIKEPPPPVGKPNQAYFVSDLAWYGGM